MWETYQTRKKTRKLDESTPIKQNGRDIVIKKEKKKKKEDLED